MKKLITTLSGIAFAALLLAFVAAPQVVLAQPDGRPDQGRMGEFHKKDDPFNHRGLEKQHEPGRPDKPDHKDIWDNKKDHKKDFNKKHKDKRPHRPEKGRENWDRQKPEHKKF